MKIKKILLSALSITIFAHPYLAYAEDIIISGNSDGSSNTINITQTQTTQAQQNNDAQINNNVSVNANTGNNAVNDNNGNASITTGDINASSQITNSGINQSKVEAGCCQNNDSTLKISGNGSNSTNSINLGNSSNTDISITNNANINNSVIGSANTGNNSASNNSGSVNIKTGSITAKDIISNKSINIEDVKASADSGGSAYILLVGNGEGSSNSVTVNNQNKLSVNIINNAKINNSSKWDLNTGNNTANNNNGDVSISTGDILFTSVISNEDINVSIVDVECCEKDNGKPKPPPDVTPPPPPPPTNPGPCTSNCGGSNPQGSPSSTQAVLGEILPVTGNYSMLLFLIGNILTLIFGGYLRLRSGRSPNYAFAK